MNPAVGDPAQADGPSELAIDLHTLKRIVAQHCPVLYLYHDDVYLPSSAEFFFASSSLSERGAGGVRALASRGELDAWEALERQRDFESEGGSAEHALFLDLNPEARPGCAPEDLASVPYYVIPKIVELDASTGDPTVLEISYATLYPYNGPYVRGLTGAHDGDWEHLTARVCWPSGALVGVWYNAHRARDGEWVPSPDVPRRRGDDRIIAYVARHGHGLYPRMGTVPRHFYFANDRTSDRGLVWDPETVVLVPGAISFEDAVAEARAAADEEKDCRPAAGSVDPGTNADASPRSTRRVRLCASRGSRLPHPGTLPVAPVSDGPALPQNGAPRPKVVASDPCPWVRFRGRWGQTTAPILQNWFDTAETPVSRTRLQRLFWHIGPETESV